MWPDPTVISCPDKWVDPDQLMNPYNPLSLVSPMNPASPMHPNNQGTSTSTSAPTREDHQVEVSPIFFWVVPVVMFAALVVAWFYDWILKR